jgi:diguanylate cyclase (GGDEF)-like protein
LFIIDLDGFKRLNDTLGHPTGDAVLRLLADRLRRCGKEDETVARLGGDEFALLHPISPASKSLPTPTSWCSRSRAPTMLVAAN